LIRGENMSVPDTGVQKLRKTSRVLHLGSLNPKCPRNPIAMAAAQ